jgi:transcriptional regulator with XRE-family HTH domain
MELGDRIRKARMEAGLTQVELAKAVGMSTRSIQAYELNQSVPRTYDLYIKLAHVLSVSPEFLSGMTEKEVEEKYFLAAATAKYGSRGKAQARSILDQATALFAGGELTEEDELVFMHEIQQIYFESKGIAKKYTPKKYIKEKKE